MTKIGPLFPLYIEKYKEFFVQPGLVGQAIVSYDKDDPYGRKGYETQFLKVPVEIPNYLALCQDPVQKPWGSMDEISSASLGVDRLLVKVKVKGEDHHFLVDTDKVHQSGFLRAPQGDEFATLDMRLRVFSGFVAKSKSNEVVGETIFADFKSAGYEPLFDFGIQGQFDRQRMSMKLIGISVGLVALRNLETNEVILTEEFLVRDLSKLGNKSLYELINSVSGLEVIGAQLRQELA